MPILILCGPPGPHELSIKIFEPSRADEFEETNLDANFAPHLRESERPEQKKNLVVEIGGVREEAAKKGGRTKVAEVEVVEAAISPVDVAPDVTPDAPQAKA